MTDYEEMLHPNERAARDESTNVRIIALNFALRFNSLEEVALPLARRIEAYLTGEAV